jgi:hypothetical protein
MVKELMPLAGWPFVDIGPSFSDTTVTVPVKPLGHFWEAGTDCARATALDRQRELIEQTQTANWHTVGMGRL